MKSSSQAPSRGTYEGVSYTISGVNWSVLGVLGCEDDAICPNKQSQTNNKHEKANKSRLDVSQATSKIAQRGREVRCEQYV